ncbi:MAG: hypothetical protein HY898_34515 [Deltaproteobacteria bacterium]|nr:hypothetical protein [Deltaproteobacteria bacterium]
MERGKSKMAGHHGTGLDQPVRPTVRRAMVAALTAIDAAHAALAAARELLTAVGTDVSGDEEDARYYEANSYPLGRRRFYDDAKAGAFPTFSPPGTNRLLARRSDVHAFIEGHARTAPADRSEPGSVAEWMKERGIREAGAK